VKPLEGYVNSFFNGYTLLVDDKEIISKESNNQPTQVEWEEFSFDRWKGRKYSLTMKKKTDQDYICLTIFEMKLQKEGAIWSNLADATLEVSNKYGSSYKADSMKTESSYWCSKSSESSSTITIRFPSKVSVSGFRVKPYGSYHIFGKYTLKVGGITVQTKDVGAQTSGWNTYLFTFTQDIEGDTFELILEKDSDESYMCIKQLEMELKPTTLPVVAASGVKPGPWQFNRGYIEQIKNSNELVLGVRKGDNPVVEMGLRLNEPRMQWKIDQPHFYITMNDAYARVLTVQKNNGKLDSRKGAMLVLETKSDEDNKLWSWDNGLLVNKLSGLALDVINGKQYEGAFWTFPADGSLEASNKYGSSYTSNAMKEESSYWCSKSGEKSATISINLPSKVTTSGFRAKPYKKYHMFGKYIVKVGGKTVQTKEVGAQTSGWNEYFFTRDIEGDTFELILEKDSDKSYMCIKHLQMEIKRNCSVEDPGALWMWKKTRNADQIWEYKDVNDYRRDPTESLVSKLDGKVLGVDKSNWQAKMRSVGWTTIPSRATMVASNNWGSNYNVEDIRQEGTSSDFWAAPTATVTASSQWDSDYTPDKILTEDGYWCAASGKKDGWLKFSFSSSTAIRGFRFKTANEASYDQHLFRDWELQTSPSGQDGTWTTPTGWNGQATKKKCCEWQEFRFDNSVEARFFRLVMGNNQGGDYLVLGELQFNFDSAGDREYWCSGVGEASVVITMTFDSPVIARGFRMKPLGSVGSSSYLGSFFNGYSIRLDGTEVASADTNSQPSQVDWVELSFQNRQARTFSLTLKKKTGQNYICLSVIEMRLYGQTWKLEYQE